MDKTENRYFWKEERTIRQAKLVGLTKPQRLVLTRVSIDIWVTASELGTTMATVRTLVKKGLLVTNMLDSELCFKARYKSDSKH
jgi:hypothetical protein